MDLDLFDRLLGDIFVDNTVEVKGRFGTRETVTPLNLERYLEQNPKSSQVPKWKVRVGESLSALKEVSRDGITSEIYKANKFAVNSAIRDATGSRWWGSGLDYNCVSEDEQGKDIRTLGLSSLPEDGRYGEIGSGHHRNITDGATNGKSYDCFEGTFFDIQYKGNKLQQARIFHQGYRSGLQVSTITIDDIMSQTDKFIGEVERERNKDDIELPLDASQYQSRIDLFNSTFGPYIQVEVVRDEHNRKDYLMLVFDDNPLELVEKLDIYGKEDGLPIRSVKKGEDGRGYTVWMDMPADFLIRRQAQRPDVHRSFDPTTETEERAMVIGNLHPDVSHPLAKSYLKHEAA